MALKVKTKPRQNDDDWTGPTEWGQDICDAPGNRSLGYGWKSSHQRRTSWPPSVRLRTKVLPWLEQRPCFLGCWTRFFVCVTPSGGVRSLVTSALYWPWPWSCSLIWSKSYSIQKGLNFTHFRHSSSKSKHKFQCIQELHGTQNLPQSQPSELYLLLKWTEQSQFMPNYVQLGHLWSSRLCQWCLGIARFPMEKITTPTFFEASDLYNFLNAF